MLKYFVFFHHFEEGRAESVNNLSELQSLLDKGYVPLREINISPDSHVASSRSRALILLEKKEQTVEAKYPAGVGVTVPFIPDNFGSGSMVYPSDGMLMYGNGISCLGSGVNVSLAEVNEESKVPVISCLPTATGDYWPCITSLPTQQDEPKKTFWNNVRNYWGY